MEWEGIFIGTHPEVYEPSDDTFLLARVVRDLVVAGDRFLEVGCGTGLSAMVAARKGAEVTCTDANPYAVALAAANAKQNRLLVTAVETDLLAGLSGPFDVVAFNPPYLPTAEDEKVSGPLNLAFDGGPSGNDTVLRFVEQVSALPVLPRMVLVIHSSLSDPAPLVERMHGLGYVADVAAEEKLFFERLTVRRFTRS